jgi:hypothetical protein
LDQTELLTLAALSYRGCEFNLGDGHSRKVVYDELDKCLRTFSTLHNHWKIAWGPAGHRSGAASLDESAMYVVRHTDNANLAIVIRGTNFFSLEDWTTNLSIDPVPWLDRSPAANVNITRSTAFGLKILQQLKAEPVPPPDVQQTAEERAEAAIVAAKGAVAYQLLQRIFAGNEHVDLVSFARELLTKLDDLRSIGTASALKEGAMLNRAAASQPATATATTLLEFLRQHLTSAVGPLDVWIVGHSKGGALAPALALWLADLQDAAAATWDSQHHATLHVSTFAAPTPGDGNFARCVQQKIPDLYRFANPHDIVPHVWDPAEVRQIPRLYDGKLIVLAPPIELLARWLDAHGYHHECPAKPWSSGPLQPASLLTQIGVNHLNAYLEEFGILSPQLNTLSMFEPIQIHTTS